MLDNININSKHCFCIMTELNRYPYFATIADSYIKCQEIVLAGHIGNTFCLRFSLQFSIYPIGVK